jgi:pimeloyl-ACP methyl ester carboxylesterase
MSLDEAYARLRDQVESPAGTTVDRVLSLAHLADTIGRRELLHQPGAALPWFRDAAAYSAFALAMLGGDPAGPQGGLRARAIEAHNRAVEEVLRCSGCLTRNGNPFWRSALSEVRVEPVSTTPERADLVFETLWVARDYTVKNMESVRWEGLGVPVIATKEFPNRDHPPGKFYPKNLRLAATAVFKPQGALEDGQWRAFPALLALHDPAHEPWVTMGATGVRPAADLTAPIAYQFIKGPEFELAWGGLYLPELLEKFAGVMMLEPPRPGKIPVLFVHGFWSSPDVWMVMANQLRADPVLRERYQYWYAYYPTGSPLMISASVLRRSIVDLRQYIDPERCDPALDQMVVVGHSLGSVISKQLVSHSGRMLEEALFTRPMESIRMSPEVRQELTDVLYFEPVPSIRRLVFIAPSHRGSHMANRMLGRVGSAFIKIPSRISAMHGEIIGLNGPDVFHEFYRERPPTTIDNLKWNSPALSAMLAMPMAPGVPFHTIVANLFPDADPAFWNDGIVSFDSAHVDGAVSEIMIHRQHFCNDSPEAIAEVRRILREHLTSLDNPGQAGTARSLDPSDNQEPVGIGVPPLVGGGPRP